MSKRERKQLPAIPRAIPRTGADIARAAKAATRAIVPAPHRSASESEPAAERKPSGAYVGQLGQFAATPELPLGGFIVWFPFPAHNRDSRS